MLSIGKRVLQFIDTCNVPIINLFCHNRSQIKIDRKCSLHLKLANQRHFKR